MLWLQVKLYEPPGLCLVTIRFSKDWLVFAFHRHKYFLWTNRSCQIWATWSWESEGGMWKYYKHDFISVIFLNYQTVGHSSLDDTSTKIQRPFELDVLRSDLVVVGLTCRVWHVHDEVKNTVIYYQNQLLCNQVFLLKTSGVELDTFLQKCSIKQHKMIVRAVSSVCVCVREREREVSTCIPQAN